MENYFDKIDNNYISLLIKVIIFLYNIFPSYCKYLKNGDNGDEDFFKDRQTIQYSHFQRKLNVIKIMNN